MRGSRTLRAQRIILTVAAIGIAAPGMRAQQRAVNPTAAPAVPAARRTRARAKDMPLSILQAPVQLASHLAEDQRAIWTSPAHLRAKDADWLLPLGALAGVLVATDRTASSHLFPSPATIRRSRELSDAGVGALATAAAGLYLWGRLTRDEHKRETGMLAGEALLSSFAATEAVKYAARRARPDAVNAGHFFAGGDSFPSEHAAAAWSMAGVIAHEYPGPLTRLLAYGLAGGVSVARVTGREHFPSDVLIGGALGWLVARQIYRARHDYDLAGGTWDWPASAGGEAPRHDDSLGSTFVPPDSWVYPAFQTLFALGYVRTSIAGMKPWSRAECARLTAEAQENLRSAGPSGPDAGEARQIVARLAREFAWELGGAGGGSNRSARVESVYARLLEAHGPVLDDGFHFGQTLAYDFGRPYQTGMNAIAGATLSATAGRYLAFARVEYQHAPAAPPLSDSVRALEARVDNRLEQPAQPFVAVDRARLVEGYVGANVRNWEILFGKQSLDWGIGRGGSLLLSDNAEPIPMIRITRSVPFPLPESFGHSVPVKTELFLGRLGGHDFIRGPLIYGQKLTFRPTPFLELGYGRTTMLGGSASAEARALGVAPSPFTTGNFINSFFATSGTPPGNSQNDFDIVLRLPRPANGIVLYTELYQDDDLIFFYRPGRGVYRPGIFIASLPGLPRMDFRAEVTSSESPSNFNHVGSLNYWHIQYRNGQTNDGYLLGNVVGRQGENQQVWLGYRISARQRLEFSFKNNLVDAGFIPGGGRWQDYTVRHEVTLARGFYLKSFLQFEHIGHFPALFAGPVNNVTASVEFGFSPREAQRP
jgi:membrane-associated phospholipid phosphatase